MCTSVTVQWELTPGVISLVSLSRNEKTSSFPFPFWQRRYPCAAKLKSVGIRHMLECFLELGAQLLAWQWFVERTHGNMERSILKVKLLLQHCCGCNLLEGSTKTQKHGTDRPVVTVSLATTAFSEYNMAELVTVAIKESTTRDMFYSGSHLGTVPGSEGNMTHTHTHAHSTLLFCLMYSHIFLRGVARKVFCFGTARQSEYPSPTWSDCVGGMWASPWPRTCLTIAHPCTGLVSCTSRNWMEQ